MRTVAQKAMILLADDEAVNREALLYLAKGAAAVLLVALSVRVLRRRQGK